MSFDSEYVDSGFLSYSSVIGTDFNFGQQVIPLLLVLGKESLHPPTSLVTDATVSIKESEFWSVAIAGKSGQPILAQSPEREFGPKGVYVAHAIMDGGIDASDATQYPKNEGTPERKISPYAISKSTQGIFELKC